MTLREVLQDVEGTVPADGSDRAVSGLCLDSRRVRPGDLFFGLAGLQADGGAFARTALGAGAVAAVVGRDVDAAGGTVVRVHEPRKALAQAACRFHGFPSRALRVFAVTGTNGKTTTTYLVHAVLEHAGLAAGLLGTTGVRLGAETRASSFTTPEAPELQGLLREMVDRGLAAVALEVSSHALVQRRAHGLECDVVAFTNLSHDHLDYHGTLEAYLDAKLMLFDGRNGISPAKRPVAVVGLDDPAASRVREAALQAGLAVRTYGSSHGADVCIREVAPREGGLDVTLLDAGETVRIALPLLGRYNAWNAACAFTAARALGLDAATVARGLESAPGVPGRLERVRAGQPFEVVVDYAHTPDALGRALAAAREHATGRVLLVFGCGGDRDRAKRPVMGRIAAERADWGVVTSDNPRSEDPAAIAREIVAGAPAGALELQLDRRAAIGAALARARAGDIVVIAGKGHETTQTIGARVLPFDDRAEAREALAGEGGAMTAFATTPVIGLVQLAQWARGDLVVREVPGDPMSREAFLRAGFDGVSIDSRTVAPGELFVPLPGSRADGHAFLDAAFERGAAAALCARAHHATLAGREPGPLVVVDDVTEALQRIARGHRETWSGTLVGVTGSVGKTTTKELVAAALGSSVPTLRTEGNLNNHWGVPLTLLRLRAEHRAAVVEIGMNHAGEVAALAALAQPGAAVITSAGSAHLEHMGSLEAIAREKASLAHALDARGVAFVNADSPRLLEGVRGVRCRVVTYGFADGADVRPAGIESLGERGSALTVAGFPRFTLALPGRHQVVNALAALAVARELRLDPDAVTRALADCRPAHGRMEIRHARGATLLVDCYNANPESLRAALETLAGWPGAARRLAVLGDMLELGPEAARLHRETAAAAGGSEVWVTGAHAADLAAGAAAAGSATRVFGDLPSLREALRGALAGGVVVLLKASRGAALERVLDGLEGED